MPALRAGLNLDVGMNSDPQGCGEWWGLALGADFLFGGWEGDGGTSCRVQSGCRDEFRPTGMWVVRAGMVWWLFSSSEYGCESA